MEYTVLQLAQISGVSARTLRYYDQIGLLLPARVQENGYRIYEKEQVDTLQQILFYRELGFTLQEIHTLLGSSDYDREQSLQSHLNALTQKKVRIETLIGTVRKTIDTLKGENTMKDTEKFEGFGQKLIRENEAQYGAEIREKYGNEAVDEANRHIQGMTREQYEKSQQLSARLEDALKAAMQTKNPAGDLAQKACALHKEWLCIFYPNYSKEYHMGLGDMYVADERFTAYYDKIAPGCAAFLRDAIYAYCGNCE